MVLAVLSRGYKGAKHINIYSDFLSEVTSSVSELNFCVGVIRALTLLPISIMGEI